MPRSARLDTPGTLYHVIFRGIEMQKLDWYRWCGHSVIIGRRKNSWQARDYVLNWFSGGKKGAVSNYRNFVKQGVALGKQSNSIEALKSGSRIDEVSKVRADLALQFVKECGLTLSESARQLGVCTSAIAKIIKRRKGKSN